MWVAEHHSLGVLAAVRQHAVPVGAGVWHGAVLRHAAGGRADWLATCRRLVAAMLAAPRRCQARGLTTVLPGSGWLAQRAGVSVRTVRRWLAWCQAHRLLLVVEHGSLRGVSAVRRLLTGVRPIEGAAYGQVYALTVAHGDVDAPQQQPAPVPQQASGCAVTDDPWLHPVPDVADRLAAACCWGRRLSVHEVQALRRVLDRWAPGATYGQVVERIEWAGHSSGPVRSPAGLVSYRLRHTQVEHDSRMAARRQRKQQQQQAPQQAPQQQPVPVQPQQAAAHTVADCRLAFWGVACVVCGRHMGVEAPPAAVGWPMIRRLRWWAANRLGGTGSG